METILNQNKMKSQEAKDILNVVELYYNELESLRRELYEAFGSDDEDTKHATIQAITIDILRDRIKELEVLK